MHISSLCLCPSAQLRKCHNVRPIGTRIVYIQIIFSQCNFRSKSLVQPKEFRKPSSHSQKLLTPNSGFPRFPAYPGALICIQLLWTECVKIACCHNYMHSQHSHFTRKIWSLRPEPIKCLYKASHPDTRITRARSALVFKRERLLCRNNMTADTERLWLCSLCSGSQSEAVYSTPFFPSDAKLWQEEITSFNVWHQPSIEGCIKCTALSCARKAYTWYIHGAWQ